MEELKLVVMKQDAELQRLKLSIEEAKLIKQEVQEKHMPDLKAPRRILPSLEDAEELTPPTAFQRCRTHTCFDFSRCSLSSSFPVFVYSPDEHVMVSGRLELFLKNSVLRAFSMSPYVTKDPRTACAYIVLIGEVTKSQLQYTLTKLPHWRGDGRNHILLHLSNRLKLHVDVFQGVNTGRAIVVQSSFFDNHYRSGFDVVAPVLWGDSHGQVWEGLPPQVPARRMYLFSFQGDYKNSQMSAVHDSVRQEQKLLKSVVLDLSDQYIVEKYIVETLKKLQSASDDGFHFSFSCPGEKLTGFFGEWELCADKQRTEVLRNSTFSLIIAPSNQTVISSALTSIRLFESLKFGAVPVILGNVELPFAELIDWKKAAFMLPRGRITELHFFIRTVMDADLLSMRRQGRIFWERHLASTDAIINTVLALLRTRLLIPAWPIPDSQSPSVFNNSFTPLTFDNIPLENEPEENVGSIEPSYSSPKFRRNYTWSAVSNVWNEAWDPFHLYPYTPFDPVLPTEAKFLGAYAWYIHVYINCSNLKCF